MKTKKAENLVILVRGIPGSGKSVLVEDLRKKHEKDTGSGPDFAVCSADKFFVGKDGVYRYDPDKIEEAHARCMSDFIDSILAKTKVIVVDNTFVHLWEMRNYFKVARLAEYEVLCYEIRVRTVAEIRACIRRNIHGVSADGVTKMAIEFEHTDDAMIVPFVFT